MEAAPDGTPLNRVPKTEDEVDEDIQEEDVNPEDRANDGVSVFGPDDFEIPEEIDIIQETVIGPVIVHTLEPETIYAKTESQQLSPGVVFGITLGSMIFIAILGCILIPCLCPSSSVAIKFIEI